MKLLALFGLLLLSAGCAHVRTGEVWGEDATIAPGWAAARRAAVEAVTDPYTWAPAVAAAVLQIGDADKDFADNMRRNNPIFGSANRWASGQ